MPKSRASVLFLLKRIKFFQRFYENLIKDLKIRGKKELHQMNIHHIIEISALRKEDGNECIRKSLMVFLRWFFQCTGLVYGRNSLEYYHHRASGRKAVLQICGPGGMALRQGDSLRRRRRLADSEYHLDDYYRHSHGS